MAGRINWQPPFGDFITVGAICGGVPVIAVGEGTTKNCSCCINERIYQLDIYVRPPFSASRAVKLSVRYREWPTIFVLCSFRVVPSVIFPG